MKVAVIVSEPELAAVAYQMDDSYAVDPLTADCDTPRVNESPRVSATEVGDPVPEAGLPKEIVGIMPMGGYALSRSQLNGPIVA